MQTSDFAPVPPYGELDQIYRRPYAYSRKHRAWFWPIGPIMWRHQQNRKYVTCCTAVRWGQSHGHT